MSTTVAEQSAIDEAIEHLANAKKVKADHEETVRRLQARQHDISADAQAAEKAALLAAAAITPDDGSASLALHELKAHASTNAAALALHRAAVDAGEKTVIAATHALAVTRARDELHEASELVTPFERALDALIAAHAGIEKHITAARRHAASAGGRRLDVPHVAGRRIRHALMAAGIDVSDRAEGPALPYRDASSAAGAIRAAIQNPRWDGM